MAGPKTARVSRVLFTSVVQGGDTSREVREVSVCAGVCGSVLCRKSLCKGPGEGHASCNQGQAPSGQEAGWGSNGGGGDH